jgi:hypothetical protein
VDVGGLGNAILPARDSASAVGSVAVAVPILIVLRNGVAPVCAALKLVVVDVDTSVDDVDIDALSALGVVDVLVECAEAEFVRVRDTCKTPRGATLNALGGGRLGDGIDDLVTLDILDFGESTDLVKSAIAELASVALNVTIVDVGQTGAVSEGIGL